MNIDNFVSSLAEIHMPGVFNPYADHCDVWDASSAAAIRKKNLKAYLRAVQKIEVREIWLGRDLGYRGGRRTGLALTDEAHLGALGKKYKCIVDQATTSAPLAERTAAEIWAVIDLMKRPPMLWNVFPFHPHEMCAPFTNRKFSIAEFRQTAELNEALFKWISPTVIVAIGQDAANYASRLGFKTKIVRHPSYGGVIEFRNGMKEVRDKLVNR